MPLICDVPPERDLWLPLPADGQTWPTHLIHTHYFGFCVPEARLGGYTYIRYHPRFPLSQGGVCIFQGLNNLEPLQMEHCDYQMTLPWPQIEGNVITTAHGLRVEFLVLGEKLRLTYESEDGTTRFDTIHAAVTPRVGRRFLMPAELELTDPGLEPGGFEQFMHCTGTLEVNGECHDIDCYPVRDRSWSQVRPEAQTPIPPLGWTPICFDGELAFNQVGYEAPDTQPEWEGIYDQPDMPPGYYGWILNDGEVREIVDVRRNVTAYHPRMTGVVKQEIEAEDERGETYHFRGEAIAMTNLPQWPNASIRDSVFRWEDAHGRVAHNTYQEIHYTPFQHAMKPRLFDAAVS